MPVPPVVSRRAVGAGFNQKQNMETKIEQPVTPTEVQAKPGSAVRGRGLKLHNSYAGSIPDYSSTPKSVFAALAYSLALRLNNDNHEAALETLRGEWSALHTAGIVPQHPPPTP